MKKTYLTLLFFTLISIVSLALFSHAYAAGNGIKLSQTRVVFDAKKKNATANIQNQGDKVYLIKASVAAAPDAKVTDEKAPFIVTPPLFRLEPKSQQTVLIIRQGTQVLPIDRESVFYLSFLAIPSTPDNHSDSHDVRISIGVETVIKLFYRPVGLTLPPQQAYTKLRFNQKGNQLVVENPTPYYITLSSLLINNKNIDLVAVGAMIAPFSQHEYQDVSNAKQVTWTVINDYGGISEPYHADMFSTGVIK